MTLKLSASLDALNLATVRNGLARATLLEDTGVSKPLALPCTDRCVGLRNCHNPLRDVLLSFCRLHSPTCSSSYLS